MNGQDSEQSRWWHFPHEADVGVAAQSPSPAEAFAQIALAMTAIVTDVPVAAKQSVRIQCDADNPEDLLLDWLNSLVFEMDTRHWLFGRFEVRIQDGHLEAVAWGEPVDRQRHEPAVDVKGATYTGLQATRDSRGLWQLRCILDV